MFRTAQFDANTIKVKTDEEAERVAENYALPPNELEEKVKLISEGFSKWSRNDFRYFLLINHRKYLNAIEKHGRKSRSLILKEVSEDTGKSVEEVENYHNAFWVKYKSISDHKKIIEKIDKAEQRLERKMRIETVKSEIIERF